MARAGAGLLIPGEESLFSIFNEHDHEHEALRAAERQMSNLWRAVDADGQARDSNPPTDKEN